MVPFKMRATTPIVRMITMQVITNMVTITPFLSSFLSMSGVVSTIESLRISAEWVGVCGNVDSGPKSLIEKKKKQFLLTDNAVKVGVIHFSG